MAERQRVLQAGWEDVFDRVRGAATVPSGVPAAAGSDAHTHQPLLCF